MEQVNSMPVVRSMDKDEFLALSLEERRERNMMIVQNIPEVGEVLKTYVPSSELVILDNGEPDVLFRGQYLYEGKGAETFTREQLDKFWENPFQITTGIISGKNMDTHAAQFSDHLVSRLDAAGIEIEDVQRAPDKRAFFLFVLGVGLGSHLEELVEQVDCQVLVIMDVNPEFMYHSLSTFDWATFLIENHKQGRSVLISFRNSPDHILTGVQGAIRQFNPSAVDGTYVYRHYHHAAFEKAWKDLITGALEIGMMGLGFLWDEQRMIANTYKNLEAGTARIMKRQEKLMNLPVFVVGNGPSLDKSIDFIKEHQDDVVIIACGSTLDALLVNGIYPDFLVMLEQSKFLLEDQSKSRELADTSDIIFVGASNIYPGVMDYHKNKILFFRPGLSTCPLFSQKDDQHPPGADPLVANAGLTFAFYAGFRNIYLFGVDVGARSVEHHHSQFSQYTTRNIKYRHKFNERGRGNFGGEIVSTKVLMWSKKTLETSIKSLGTGRTIINCSDGMLIKGALPRHQSVVEIPKTGDKRQAVRELLERFPYYAVEDFKKAWEGTALRKNLPAFCDKLVACLDDGLDSGVFMKRVMQLLEPASNTSTLAMLVRGSVFHMLMEIYTKMRRLKDRSRLEDYENLVREAFKQTMDEIVEECDAWFASLENGTMNWETADTIVRPAEHLNT